jgi:ATP-dependent Zn protease
MDLSGKSNINPKIWGPYFWETFHFTAFGYPNNPTEDDKIAYKTFFIHFLAILPCDKCRISSQEIINIKELEGALKSRELLIKWTYNFHDKVNKKLNTTSPDYETFKTNFQNRDTSNVLTSIIIMIVLIIILYLIMSYTSNNL